MKTLALTTATLRCGVALVHDGATVATRTIDEDRLHAERLFAMVDEVLAEAGWCKASLELVACDVGPGSFTGVRVGLASAKGIALGLGIPLVGVGSLEAMAYAALAVCEASTVMAILDARRGERFVSVVDRSSVRVEPRHVANEEVAALAATFGDGLVVCGEAASVVDESRILVDARCRLPDPAWVGILGHERVRRDGPHELDSLEPTYVRPPDAKLPSAAGVRRA